MESSGQLLPIQPPGTYVRAAAPPTEFVEDKRYDIVAVRCVLQPSLARIVDRVTSVARAVCSGRYPGNQYEEIYGAMMDLRARVRRELATRDPRVMIPFVGACGRYLSPLQLLDDVACCRVHLLSLPGSTARDLYPFDRQTRPEIAPEVQLTPATVGPASAQVEYLDVLAEDRPSRTSVVLISNSAVLPQGYQDIGPERCVELASLLMRIRPESTTPEGLTQLPRLPDSHLDWGLAVLLRHSLGGAGKGE
jgi:hypothetical protein